MRKIFNKEAYKEYNNYVASIQHLPLEKRIDLATAKLNELKAFRFVKEKSDYQPRGYDWVHNSPQDTEEDYHRNDIYKI